MGMPVKPAAAAKNPHLGRGRIKHSYLPTAAHGFAFFTSPDTLHRPGSKVGGFRFEMNTADALPTSTGTFNAGDDDVGDDGTDDDDLAFPEYLTYLNGGESDRHDAHPDLPAKASPLRKRRYPVCLATRPHLIVF